MAIWSMESTRDTYLFEHAIGFKKIPWAFIERMHFEKFKSLLPPVSAASWGYSKGLANFWSEVGTKSKAKVPNFGGNFKPSYLRTGKRF